MLLSQVCVAGDEDTPVRECSVGAARMHTHTGVSFDPIPAVSLQLDSTTGAGFQLGCSTGFEDSGWFVRGSYQQTTGDLRVELRLDDELATGRFDLDQRVVDFDIGYRADLWSNAVLKVSVGYSRSWFEPDSFLMVLPSGGAQFDHRGALAENDAGITVATGISWQAAERLGLDLQLRYRDRSSYELTGAKLRSEVLWRFGTEVKMTEATQLVLETDIGEKSRSSHVGLRWYF